MAQNSPGCLGKHTAVSCFDARHIREIPYLRENEGRLPPFIIAVGDSRRVEAARDILPLKEPAALHQYGERLLGLPGRGRVAMLIGLYEHEGRAVPLLVAETQMGMSPLEIVMREIFCHAAADYSAGGRRVSSPRIYAVRAGTAAGINAGGAEEIRVGDVVNAAFTLGWSGALLQSCGVLDFGSAAGIETFRRRWRDLGFGFTADGAYPVAECDRDVVAAIARAAKELDFPSHQGGNFSKDSLYAEADEEVFVDLRRSYGILSTEMEQIMLCALAAQMRAGGVPAAAGLVSGVVGVIPGASFGADEEIRLAEERALRAAARALWLLAEGATH